MNDELDSCSKEVEINSTFCLFVICWSIIWHHIYTCSEQCKLLLSSGCWFQLCTSKVLILSCTFSTTALMTNIAKVSIRFWFTVTILVWPLAPPPNLSGYWPGYHVLSITYKQCGIWWFRSCISECNFFIVVVQMKYWYSNSILDKGSILFTLYVDSSFLWRYCAFSCSDCHIISLQNLFGR